MLIKTWNNQEIDLPIEIANTGDPVALPALIDPHVHFRTPGAEQKENWITGTEAALAGGVTTVFDMPNNNPAVIDYQSIINKKQIINEQIKLTGKQLNYYLYLGATPNNYTEFAKCKNEIIGVKLFMGASTGDLLVEKLEDQENIFKTCAELDLVLAVHAESEEIIKANSSQFTANSLKTSGHSKIRSREAAVKAVTQALSLAKKYNTKLYICHVSTKEEITQAKSEGVTVYAEVAPHHLFLTENDYERLGTLGQMNPPLRTISDQIALWQAITNGIIDTIGTDHAPHTLEEKSKTYPNSPSGVPGIETLLPLLLNAYHEGKISLQKIVELTKFNIEKIFNLPPNNDWVIADLNLEKKVENKNLKTKCGWSPYSETKLKGWPIMTV